MADKQAQIDQFIGITSVDADRARFYLESSAWNLELAIASFYEDGDGEHQPDEREMDDISNEPAATASLRAETDADPSSRQKKESSSRFGTISSMRREEDSDSNEGQAFYAGGSERSGQQVLGPPRKKLNPDEMVDSLFKSAKEHGAEVVESEDTRRSKPGPSFRGAGYRLGDTEEKSDMIPGTHTEAPRQVDMVLKLWKNGFSIDNGPQREYSDPSNKEFLDSVSKGEVPRELIRLARGGEVNLNMEDHRTEDYVKPKVQLKAFTGEGHMLGSPAPNVVSKPPASTAGGNTTQQSSVNVDASQPTTTLQIRLADGSRMVAKFNHSHQISDIRNYIISLHPQYAETNFILMTTFPNKELSDESQTLENAKLLNAVIVQRQK